MNISPFNEKLWTMNSAYLRAIRRVFCDGVDSAPRGLKVREVENYIFSVESPLQCISSLQPFHTRMEYAEAELIWYMRGSKRIKDLVHPETKKSFAHLWEKFSDDGVEVNSAYGQYIFNQTIITLIDNFGGALKSQKITQWDWVKEKLQEDSDTRHAIININQPMSKFRFHTKDFPCCIAMHFTIRNNKLNLQVIFRSQDVNTGLRNDIYTMCGLQRLMAQELNIDYGTFTNIALNLHLYEKDFPAVEKMLTRLGKI